MQAGGEKLTDRVYCDVSVIIPHVGEICQKRWKTLLRTRPFAATQPMVQDFCAALGWDADGRPTPEKLRELRLE